MSAPLNVLFTGDVVMCGSARLDQDGKYNLLISEEIKELFTNSDFNIINLENPLTLNSQKIEKTGPHMKAEPHNVQLLKDINVHLACLANNHIRDYGDHGVNETIETCFTNGISSVGAGEDLLKASVPYIFEKGRIKIGVLNFSESEFNYATEARAGSNPDEPIHIWRSIKEIREKVNFVFVVMHGGREMYPFPTPYQVELYRFIIDLGADAVIGHHSHVIGGYEVYNNKPIFYSLGNFIFDEPGEPAGFHVGVLIKLQVDCATNEVGFTAYQTQLKDKRLALINSFSYPNLYSQTSFLNIMNFNQVESEWKELINRSLRHTVNNTLDLKLHRRVFNKFFGLKLSKKEHHKFLALGNKLTCKTHRDLIVETILSLSEKR